MAGLNLKDSRIVQLNHMIITDAQKKTHNGQVSVVGVKLLSFVLLENPGFPNLFGL